MSAAVELLGMLREQGFTLAAEGGRIRVMPASLLTEQLRSAIRAHRAELVAALDTAAAKPLAAPAEPGELPADPAGLQARLHAMMSDPAWATRWAGRLKIASDAAVDAVRKTTADMLKLASDRHRAGDAAGFAAWARFTLDHAAGLHFDDAARRPVTWPTDVEIITADEATATFADAQAVRHRRLRNRNPRRSDYT